MVLSMFVPPAILVALERAKMTPKRAAGKYSLEFSLLFLQLYVAIPTALAVFPRMGTIKASDLEPEFQKIRTEKGDLITEFTFNKGL